MSTKKKGAKAENDTIQIQNDKLRLENLDCVAISKFGDLTKLDEKTYRLIFGDNGRPPKDWWDSCVSTAKGFADDPAAFCSWLYHYGPSNLRSSFGATSNVSNKGGDQMSEEPNAFEKCVNEKMETEGMTREEAEEACKEYKESSGDQNGEKTPWQLCIQRNMAKGLTKEQARMKCKEEGVKQDQEETETPWQKCIKAEKAANPDMTDEEAVEACIAKGVAQDQEPGSPETLDPSEEEQPLPTPLEQCVANRMETMGESEEAATAWCEADLAGEHTPAEKTAEAIDELLKKDRMRTIQKRQRGQTRPF